MEGSIPSLLPDPSGGATMYSQPGVKRSETLGHVIEKNISPERAMYSGGTSSFQDSESSNGSPTLIELRLGSQDKMKLWFEKGAHL